MWQVSAPFLGWAVASLLLGLGFTFFSGATEAWLVDALKSTDFKGDLEGVFGRAQVVGGVAMLTGSVAGGVVAQLTDLGVPYILRAALLGVTLVVAWWAMHDMGFSPQRDVTPLKAVRNVVNGAVDGGLRNPPVRWLMISAPFVGGVGIYAFYAFQPYLLELYGDPNAYSIAGLAAAILAGAQILGGLFVRRIRLLFSRRTDALLIGGVLNVALLFLVGFMPNFVVAIVLLAVWALIFAIQMPIRQAFINGAIRSEQRATVLSFDSLMSPPAAWSSSRSSVGRPIYTATRPRTWWPASSGRSPCHSCTSPDASTHRRTQSWPTPPRPSKPPLPEPSIVGIGTAYRIRTDDLRLERAVSWASRRMRHRCDSRSARSRPAF